jgi:uncharacterized protein
MVVPSVPRLVTPFRGLWLPWVLGIVLLTASACRISVTAPEPTALRLATGVPGQKSYSLGIALAAVLVQAFPTTLVIHLQTDSSAASLELIELGKADLALAQADKVYRLFQRKRGEGSSDTAADDERSNLRGVAVLYPSVVHLVAASNGPVRSLTDLRGKRVAVGTSRGAHTEQVARVVLSAAGVPFEEIEPLWLSRAEVAQGLAEGTIEAAFRTGGLDLAGTGARVRLVPIDAATARIVRDSQPFLRPMVVPPGTYSAQPQPVDSVGTDVMLACRNDVPQEMIYRVMQVLVAALPRLAADHPVLRMLELESMSATPIPLHAGAACFYREEALFR